MTIEKGQKLWLSKYALSSGMREVEALGLYAADQNLAMIAGTWEIYRIGRDVHTTRNEAAISAEAARIKKIASLRKQIAKLEKLSFTVTA